MTVHLAFDHGLVVLFVLFFFQAEDGIRDLVRSRGLGDVYKRQGVLLATLIGALWFLWPSGGNTGKPVYIAFVAGLSGPGAVSYTHLTLPTIYSV